jgi:hypothetical protein
MPNISAWLAQLNQLNANPGDIQALQLQQLEDTLAGTTDVADPGNPFIFLMEASAVNSAGAMLSYEDYTRLTYGSMAQTPAQLYTQMSDVDYLNRFAIPSTAVFYLLIQYDQLIAAMVPTGVNNISQVTIPRYMAVTVNGVTFTAQYPINIIQMSGGGLQITYDNSELSPVQSLSTNIVPWEMVTLNDLAGQTGPTEYVALTLNLQQFAINSQTGKVNNATGFVQTYPYTDQFYYCRAFSIDNAGNKTEILTTHTDQNFDPTTPTLLLQDLGGSLQVELPIIYLTNGTIGGEIEVDIYTTKGSLTLDLSQYAPNSFTIAWNGADTSDSQYVAPLTNIATMTIYSSGTGSVTSGGSNGMTFATLRAQVLANNYGPVTTPITPSQVSEALQNLGYQSVTDVDIVTDRIIIATRALPPPSNGVTTGGASMTIQTLVASTNQLAQGSTVVDNSEEYDRITLLPTTLYELVNGQLSVVPDVSLAALKALANDSLVNAINNATYLYSPFHYVLDFTNNMFELRPYYLEAPAVNSVQFVEANQTAGITVGTAYKEIIATPTGYRLRIQCQSSQTWKSLPDGQCFCQIAFIPEGETDYAYMNGTLIGTLPLQGATASTATNNTNERVYEFDITTNFDVDANDDLSLTSFQMFNDTVRVHATSLTDNFQVFWIAQGIINSQTQTTNIDLIMGTDLLPSGCLGLAQETMNISLGVALDNGLWHRSRTIAGSGLNQVYSANVYQTYASVVYARDSNGNIILTNNNGTVSFQILHNAGDPVLDSNGNQVLLHAAGDPVLDANGNPIPISDGTLQRQCDLFLIEGVYYFATDADTSAYAATIAPTIVDWITTDLASVQSTLIEETNLYFYPQITVGDVEVLVQTGKTATIAAEQQFSVLYYLDSTAWNDTSLRQPLTQQAITTLYTACQSKTLSLLAIQSSLASQVGSDIVGIDIEGLGGSLDLSTVTVVDDSARLSLWHQAVVEPDGTIGVADGVAVNFVEHDTSTNTTTIATAAASAGSSS